MLGNINPCVEISLAFESPDQAIEREDFRRELVDHLQSVGWKINHKWLDKEAEKTDPNGHDVLRRTIWGLHNGDYHLISNCSKFTVRIRKHEVAFWRKDPTWKKVTDVPLKEIEFTERGIKYNDIIEIIV